MLGLRVPRCAKALAPVLIPPRPLCLTATQQPLPFANTQQRDRASSRKQPSELAVPRGEERVQNAHIVQLGQPNTSVP